MAAGSAALSIPVIASHRTTRYSSLWPGAIVGATGGVRAEKEKDHGWRCLRLSIRAEDLRFKREYQANELKPRSEELAVRRLEA